MPLAQNPADIVLRECNINEIKSLIWFTGPDFLQKNVHEWPKNTNFELSSENILFEKKKPVDAVLLNEKEQNRILELIIKKSSVDKIIRILAYIVRFISNLQNSKG